MANSFKYCVLRFRPDVRRGETVNIGIAVFLHGRLDVHLGDSFAKAQALVPGLSFDSLATLPARLNEIARDSENPEEIHALLQRFGPVTAGPLGTIEIHSDEQYEHAVARLLIDFVFAPRSLIRPRARPGRLKGTIKQLFAGAGVLGSKIEDIENHKVVCGYPVSEPENLFADFAFKNGVYRFAQIVDLNVGQSSLASKFKDCCEKAVVLDKAKRAFGSDSRRVVLFSARDQGESTVDAALNLLSDYSSTLLNADNPEDMGLFATEFAGDDLAGRMGALDVSWRDTVTVA